MSGGGASDDSSPLDQIFSRCEPDPTVTRDDAVTEGRRILSIAQFKTGVPQWNEARTPRYLACQQWWCRCNVMVPMQATVWQKSSTVKPKTSSDVGEKDRAVEDGVRLVRARTYCADPRARALSIMSYIALLHVEALVCFFFYLAGDTIDGNLVVPKGGNLALHQLPYSLS